MKECGGGSWDKTVFRLYDVDNSGFITVSDMKIVLPPFQGMMDTDHSNAIYQLIISGVGRPRGLGWDLDGDGKVSFQEFLKRLT